MAQHKFPILIIGIILLQYLVVGQGTRLLGVLPR